MENKEKKLKSRIKSVENQLKEAERIRAELLNEQIIKEYIAHLDRLEKIKKLREDVIYDYKIYQIFNCNHDAIAFFNFEYDDYEERSYCDWGCLKCGLNTFIIKNQSTFNTPEAKAISYCYREQRLGMRCRYREQGLEKGKHVINLDTYFDFLNECENYQKEQEQSKQNTLKNK